MWKSYDSIFYPDGTIDDRYVGTFTDQAAKDWRRHFSTPNSTWHIIIDKPDFIVMHVSLTAEFYRVSINIREEE